jgi:hypothetical protein
MSFSNRNKLSSWWVYGDIDRHSCEDKNPENSLPTELDARLRGYDKKITPTLQQINLSYSRF